MDKRLKNLSALRVFDSAARNQSYSRAADELSITQAAVSQQIRAFEASLQTKLFKRDGRNMLLTAKGQTLAVYVRESLSHLIEGFNQIQEEPLAGVLNVTTTASFASCWLLPNIWGFTKVFPEVTIRVTASPTVEDLQHSNFDVAIRLGNTVYPELQQETLFEDPVFPVCSASLIDKYQITTPEDLLRCHLIEGTHKTEFDWAKWFELAGIKYSSPSITSLQLETSEMALAAVLQGEGVFLCCESLVSDQLKQGTLVKPFDLKLVPGPRVSFVYAPDNPKQARIKAFRNWVFESLIVDK